MTKWFAGMFIAVTYIVAFYLGYKFSIDIFELICFRTDL